MSFLGEILARKREEVRLRRASVSDEALEASLVDRTPISLRAALSPPGGPTKVIAEIKRASPSVGTIDRSLDAAGLSVRYQEARAAAISVLTDGPGFGGSLEDLRAVRGAVALPLLRKDFIIDRYQLLEARAAGADAALLIVAALEPSDLTRLLAAATALRLECLVEVHDEEELNIALAAGASVVGVNNRDLRSFQIDLAVSEQLIPRIPHPVRAVAESGVRGPGEVRRLREAGARNFLIGEALVRDPALLTELTG